MKTARIDFSRQLTFTVAFWAALLWLATDVTNLAAASPGAFTLSNDAPYWDTEPPPGPAVNLKWTASSGATSYD